MQPLPSEPRPVAFAVHARQDAGVTTVVVEGEVDIATVDAVREVLQRTTGPVVLDLAGVTFLDTSGLRLVVEQDRQTRSAGRPFTILPGPAEVQRLFDIAGLRDRLPFATPDDAPGPGPGTGA